MAKKTILIPDQVHRAVTDYRKAHPKDDGDLPTYSWAVIELLTKGLEAEGIKIGEEA